MDTILISIKPCHLHNIRTGKKRYELRKSFPASIDVPFRVLCCESGSGGEIKAEFECVGRFAIWQNDLQMKEIAEKACVSEREIDLYMGTSDYIYAWKIGEVIDYTRDKGHKVRNIRDYGFKRPPQSWVYVKDVVCE